MSACTFEEKSDVTFLSAELLFKNKKHNSCVNGYYYSCFQLINHFIRNVFNVSKDEFNLMIEKMREDDTKFTDSHNMTINIFGNLMADKGINDTNLLSILGFLKKVRKQADYDESFVDVKLAEQSSKKAEYFIQTLKDYKDELI